MVLARDAPGAPTAPYLVLRSSNHSTAAQPVVQGLVRLQLARCSGQGGEAGETQLEAGRRRLGRRRRRLRSGSLHHTETQG